MPEQTEIKKEKTIWENQREVSNETYVNLMLIEVEQINLILDELVWSGNSLTLHKNMLACRLAELQQTRHLLNGLNKVGKEITNNLLKPKLSV